MNKRKKKKGFTLIELVIVLAVLAIIALIAIPNFTKIRTKSITDADFRAAEQIEKITLMGIANGDIVSKITAFKVGDNGSITDITGTNVAAEKTKFVDLFRDSNGPQEGGVATDSFDVTINSGTGSVAVKNGAKLLAGKE